jgi:hypothetical protein
MLEAWFPTAQILGNHLGQTWQLTEWLCTAWWRRLFEG